MTRIKFLLTVAIFVGAFSFSVSGQDTKKPDSLVFFNELTYQSDFEKESFEQYIISSEKDYTAIFLAVSENTDEKSSEKIQNTIQSTIDKYNIPSFKKMKETKKTKKILKQVHEDYFKKYEEEAYFDDVFTNGNFNCVTASALYSIIFEALEIPYSIKISLDHVFLVAYPTTNSIMIETTNPMEGYYVYDQHFKEKYVEYLKTIKLISAEEFKNKTTEDLFEEFFYGEKDINLQELVGILYYNRGIAYINEEKYEDAFYVFEKAYYLFPSERTGYYLLVSNALTMADCNFLDIKYADFLIKLCRYKDLGVSNDNIIAEFSDITNKVLINNSNTKIYDEYFEKLNLNLNDSTLKAEIGFIYNFERARFSFNKSNYNESLPFSMEAYKINPKHADAENMFISNLVMNYVDDDNYLQILDNLNNYADDFPVLQDNNKFSLLRNSLILNLCERNFIMRQNEKAFEYLNMFEESVPDDINSMDFQLIKVDIVNAYSAAGSYYFRKENYTKAKEYINKGLEFAPNNFELRNKLGAIELNNAFNSLIKK